MDFRHTPLFYRLTYSMCDIKHLYFKQQKHQRLYHTPVVLQLRLGEEHQLNHHIHFAKPYANIPSPLKRNIIEIVIRPPLPEEIPGINNIKPKTARIIPTVTNAGLLPFSFLSSSSCRLCSSSLFLSISFIFFSKSARITLTASMNLVLSNA